MAAHKIVAEDFQYSISHWSINYTVAEKRGFRTSKTISIFLPQGILSIPSDCSESVRHATSLPPRWNPSHSAHAQQWRIRTRGGVVRVLARLETDDWRGPFEWQQHLLRSRHLELHEWWELCILRPKWCSYALKIKKSMVISIKTPRTSREIRAEYTSSKVV